MPVVPRAGSVAAEVVEILRRKPGGASLAELRETIAARRGPVLPHSLRSAVYAHLDDAGEGLFVKVGRSRYALKK